MAEDGGAAVAVRGEGDAEGQHGETGGVGRFVPVEEGAGEKGAAMLGGGGRERKG